MYFFINFNMLSLVCIHVYKKFIFAYNYIAPAVKRFRALRVNNTTFNFTLEVFYTGGGDIEQFSIQNGSSTFILLMTVAPVQSQTSPRLWYAIVTDLVLDGLEEPRFDITIVNAVEQSIVQQVPGEVGKNIAS